MNLVKSIKNLTRTEKIIWTASILSILVSSLLFPNPDLVSVITSALGATALIFVSKGDPLGQLMCIIFGVIYAFISFHLRYYGEMITYVGMTVPSAVWALYTWLKNPYTDRQVKVAEMTAKKWMLVVFGGLASSLIMYFVLGFFGTANLIISTVSVATSFMASMLTVLRSPLYALFYAANDVVLIALWVLACIDNIGYLPMVICFIIFLVNDAYGFINWRKMKKIQGEGI